MRRVQGRGGSELPFPCCILIHELVHQLVTCNEMQFSLARCGGKPRTGLHVINGCVSPTLLDFLIQECMHPLRVDNPRT